MNGRALTALLLAVLFIFQAGCGRKAKPEPRNASRAQVLARHDITLSR